jgi:type III secretion protein U
MVMAKGTDLLARRMIEVAQQEGIPILQNVPLARDLYEHGDVNQYIPRELIEPVAEVLRWVQQLAQERGPM